MAPHTDDAEPTPVKSFLMGGTLVTPAEVIAATNADLQALLEPLAAHIDLCEPFGRIRAALTEAQIASQDAAESTHGNAAAA